MLRRNALVILILSAVVAHLPCSYAQESKSGSLTTQDYIDISNFTHGTITLSTLVMSKRTSPYLCQRVRLTNSSDTTAYVPL